MRERKTGAINDRSPTMPQPNPTRPATDGGAAVTNPNF